MSRTLTLRKARRLCLKRDVDALFRRGLPSAMAFPLRAVWHEVEADAGGAPYKMMAVAPKRRLRHAVDRNRAKRQVREAFRLMQEHLPQTEGRCLHVAFLWVSDTPQSTDRVKAAMARLLHKISTHPRPAQQ
ncbi:MAG: ribonuclease P protein component [Bacteroidaceae bacterium]|nr:ribonuclease P protein component [Bacteroidaceae bacterium]